MTSSEDGAMDIGSAHLEDETRDPAKNAKRSCNNCRQQKLKCDVIQSPFKACSRCRRLQKECKVEREFKRVGKRDKYAAMQREIDDLRRLLKLATQANASNAGQALPKAAVPEDPGSGSTTKPRQLGDVELPGEVVEELFKEYFTQYHPDPESTPDHYFDLSPLLGWSIIIVAERRFLHGPPLLDALATDYNKLLWSTTSENPQPFHVVKALCLICTWPLPSTTNPSDSTYSLSSLIISIALQNVLDFPIQMQFSRKTINEDEQRDRRLTWAACNIVAQCTSTAYGFPSQANFDRLLGSDFIFLSAYNFPKDLLDHLLIAQLYATIGTTLYGKASDPNGLPLEDERAPAYNHVKSLYGELTRKLGHALALPMTTEIFPTRSQCPSKRIRILPPRICPRSRTPQSFQCSMHVHRKSHGLRDFDRNSARTLHQHHDAKLLFLDLRTVKTASQFFLRKDQRRTWQSIFQCSNSCSAKDVDPKRRCLF